MTFEAISKDTGELVPLKPGLGIPGKVTAVGLDLPHGLSFEAWESIGSTLTSVEGSVMWWIGDWVNYGEKNFGETYTQAMDATEKAYQTVADAAWVAGKFQFSRRRENLSWSHHKDVAGLQSDEADDLLDWCVETGASTRELRHEIKKRGRTTREADLASRITALPDKKYGVILADPEWKFETYSPLGKDLTSAENHYLTSDLDVIKARGVAEIAADDCVLFLWATVPMLPQAIEVMTAWGFEYVSGVAWDKQKTGTGYWFMNQHEHLLVGRKGNVVPPAMGTQWASVISEKAREHSRKPDASYEMIEAYYPNVPKIEMNARVRRDGWDSWGTLEAI